MHYHIRVDVLHTRLQQRRLLLPMGRRKGLQLPVAVRGVHDIAIHQGEGAHAGSGQKFYGKTAHPAKANHQNVRFLQALNGVGANE